MIQRIVLWSAKQNELAEMIEKVITKNTDGNLTKFACNHRISNSYKKYLFFLKIISLQYNFCDYSFCDWLLLYPVFFNANRFC